MRFNLGKIDIGAVAPGVAYHACFGSVHFVWEREARQLQFWRIGRAPGKKHVWVKNY